MISVHDISKNPQSMFQVGHRSLSKLLALPGMVPGILEALLDLLLPRPATWRKRPKIPSASTFRQNFEPPRMIEDNRLESFGPSTHRDLLKRFPQASSVDAQIRSPLSLIHHWNPATCTSSSDNDSSDSSCPTSGSWTVTTQNEDGL